MDLGRVRCRGAEADGFPLFVSGVGRAGNGQ